MIGRRSVDRQRRVGEDLAEKKPRAGLGVEQVRVLADPAEAGVARECFLQNRAAVDEYAMRLRNAVSANLFGELREPAAQNLVVVAAERIARHVRALGIGEDL